MAVDISAAVTSIWPTTEGILAGEAGVNYAAQKATMVERAKWDLYGAAPPNEDDIPDSAAYWIADRAVVLLIPLARDHFMTKRSLSTSKDGATITHYNILNTLKELKAELEGSLAANRAAALGAVRGDADDEGYLPAVSTAGLLVDPVERSFKRGPW